MKARRSEQHKLEHEAERVHLLMGAPGYRNRVWAPQSLKATLEDPIGLVYSVPECQAILAKLVADGHMEEVP